MKLIFQLFCTVVAIQALRDESLTQDRSLDQKQLRRYKRSPFQWPSWSDVGKGFEDLGKQIHLDKVAQDVEDTVKKIDFKKVGEDIESFGKKALEEVKKPIENLVQTPKTFVYEAYTELPPGAEDFCAYQKVEMPDFRSPGHQISEIKCAEYSWQVNDLKRIAHRNDECLKQEARAGKYYVLSGENTSPGEFPHMAAIGWKATTGTWVFKCGGSLISPNFVLTAGHCIKSSLRDTSISEAEPSIVRLGDKNIIDKVYDNVEPVDKRIIRRIPHPRYASPRKYFDAALLELESAAPFTMQVHPACLWHKPDFSEAGAKAIVTGWGVLRTGSLENSPELQKATIDLLDTETCAPLLRGSQNRNWRGFHEDQMCAGVLAGGADTCQGDSGGPLQVKKEDGVYYLLGVTSFGQSCGQVNKPGVYAKVSRLIAWVESVVWPSA